MATLREWGAAVRIVRGTFAYAAGVSGTVTIAGEVKLWSATAGAAAATVTIDAGDSITIPAGQALTGEPEQTLKNPTFVFTATTAYYIEYMTP